MLGENVMDANSHAKSFKLVGGNPSLDFANTVGGRDGNSVKRGSRDYRDAILSDKLDGYADLVAWSSGAGLLTDKEARQMLRLAENDPKAAQAVFQRGLNLRHAIYRLFKSAAEAWQPDAADLEKLNEELRIATGHEKLVGTRGGFNWGWIDRGEALDCMLWQLAQSAAELLTSGDLSRVRQCGGEKCGWLFLDTSRNRSRQWCDMKDCGNLAKVRRFRRRQRMANSK